MTYSCFAASEGCTTWPSRVTSVPFTTYGISPQRDGVLIGFAANTAIADATSVYLRYEGIISGQDNSHALTAGVRMSW